MQKQRGHGHAGRGAGRASEPDPAMRLNNAKSGAAPGSLRGCCGAAGSGGRERWQMPGLAQP
eukprot:9345570-Alexandrium_andersonii.AAC.1